MTIAQAFILNNGEVLLTQASTPVNLINSQYLFGQVQLISAVSDKYRVGQYVMYNPSNATQLTYNGATYYFITEDSMFFAVNV